MEKLCVFCKHFDWESIGYTYYSTITGGSTNGGMTCRAGKYWEERPSDTEEFRALILRAETCADYARPAPVSQASGEAEAK